MAESSTISDTEHLSQSLNQLAGLLEVWFATVRDVLWLAQQTEDSPNIEALENDFRQLRSAVEPCAIDFPRHTHRIFGIIDEALDNATRLVAPDAEGRVYYHRYDMQVTFAEGLEQLRNAIPELIHSLASLTLRRSLDDIDTTVRRVTESVLEDSDTSVSGHRLMLSKAGPTPEAVAVDVLYATSRNRTSSNDISRMYGYERSEDGLHFGQCVVSVPTDRKMGALTAPRWWRFEFKADPSKHVMVTSKFETDGRTFFGRVGRWIEQSSEKSAFVFIHGFNTSFVDAIRRTGQLAYDLGFSGAPICFSWPTRGKIAGYPADEASIKWTVPLLVEFLETISDQCGADYLHLIAHSMGSRALIEAMERIETSRVASIGHLFQEVILAAPDIDAGVFRNLASALDKQSHRVTLYVSSNDKALAASTRFHQYPRAGESGNQIVVAPGIDTIDVSSVNTGLLGHSYYGSNRTIVSDIFQLLRNGLPPERRPGLQRKILDQLAYWVFVP